MTTADTNTALIPTPTARSLMAMQDVLSTLKATARAVEAQHDEVARQYRQAVRDASKAQGRTNLVREWIDLARLNVTADWNAAEGVWALDPRTGYVSDFIFTLEILHNVSTAPLRAVWNATPVEVRPEHESVEVGLAALTARLNAGR